MFMPIREFDKFAKRLDPCIRKRPVRFGSVRFQFRSVLVRPVRFHWIVFQNLGRSHENYRVLNKSKEFRI